MASACTPSLRALLPCSQFPISLLSNSNSLFLTFEHNTARRYSPIVNRPTSIVRALMGNSAAGNSNARAVAIGSAITVTLAIANRVLYKLALVPMKQYVGFYFSVLYARYRAGLVTDEMLALPKWGFTAIGFLEALGLASGMAAAALLPGLVIPILNQSFLVWQLAFSALLLGRRYSFNQIAGCLLVTAGVSVAVASGSDTNQLISGTNFVWPAVMIASAAFQAGASTFKEFVFIDAGKRLKGKSLDIFVVNSFGSGYQALFILLLLPFLSNLRGIPFSQLPSYLKSGAGCFLKIGGNMSGCHGAPILPLLYIVSNMAFNISVLNLMKVSSAVVASLAVTLSVPLTIYVLSLPLPYLPEGSSLSPSLLFGSAILLLGLILYNISKPAKEESKAAWPFFFFVMFKETGMLMLYSLFYLTMLEVL